MEKEKRNPSHGRRASHSILSDCWFVIRILWQEYRIYLFIYILWALMLPICATVSPFISKYAMDVIAEPQTRGWSIFMLGALILLEAAACRGKAFCIRYVNSGGTTWLYWIFNRKLFEKRLSMDYQNMEDTSANDSFQKAHNGVMEIGNSLQSMRNFFDSAARVVIYTIVLAGLSPVMIPVASFPAVLFFFADQHINRFLRRNTDKWTGFDRQLNYIHSAASDFSYAKDVRLCGMSGWLSQKFEEIWKKRLFWHRKFDRHLTAWRCGMDILPMLSLFVSYMFIVYSIFQREIGAGDFVLYFAATQNYGGAIFGFANNFSGFYRIRDNINYYRDYLDIPDRFNHGKGVPLPENIGELTFRNVSYTYPNAESPTIKNISFTLKKGEKLALVGLNGAGKSTLIKLMCGLYDPTEGAVLLNGIDIRRFNREAYYALFSTVFQDFDILPLTISQNITQSENGESESGNVSVLLKKAGLYDTVQTLPNRENTLLGKSVYDEATDFSGGEMQKLALAKALYKNAPFLLLDEPTAALDPISEQEMYLQYAEFTKGKSSVFISHRLASTRFCDNILLVEEGQVCETGTHGQLMEKGGKYAALFEIQSAYYKDERGGTKAWENTAGSSETRHPGRDGEA